MIKKILPIGALALAFTGSAWAMDAASLLNKANQMNYEEIETAKLAHEKAGDNQALLTYADTIKGDHEANEESVSALSRQKSVKLEGTDTEKVDKSPMKTLRAEPLMKLTSRIKSRDIRKLWASSSAHAGSSRAILIWTSTSSRVSLYCKRI